MKEKEVLSKANELLEGKLIAKGVHNVNHVLGHPYTIGPKHIHWSTILDEHAIESMEKAKGPSCAHTNYCNRYYHEHTSDKVLFLQLTQNLENEEVAKLIYKVKEVILIPEKFAGIGFIDTPEKFRISNPV